MRDMRDREGQEDNPHGSALDLGFFSGEPQVSPMVRDMRDMRDKVMESSYKWPESRPLPVEGLQGGFCRFSVTPEDFSGIVSLSPSRGVNPLIRKAES